MIADALAASVLVTAVAAVYVFAKFDSDDTPEATVDRAMDGAVAALVVSAIFAVIHLASHLAWHP